MKKILLVCAAILAFGAMAACKNRTASETDTTRNEDTCHVGNDIFAGYDDHGITFYHGGYTWIRKEKSLESLIVVAISLRLQYGIWFLLMNQIITC